MRQVVFLFFLLRGLFNNIFDVVKFYNDVLKLYTVVELISESKRIVPGHLVRIITLVFLKVAFYLLLCGPGFFIHKQFGRKLHQFSFQSPTLIAYEPA